MMNDVAAANTPLGPASLSEVTLIDLAVEDEPWRRGLRAIVLTLTEDSSGALIDWHDHHIRQMAERHGSEK